MKRRWKEQEEWGRHRDYLEQIKHICSCGHVVYVPKRNIFVYCTWCFRKVFQDEKSEFEYNILKHIGKVNNREVR